SWVSEASVNSGAVLATVRNALPSLMPVAVDGGPTGLPSTNVPPGADTDDTSASWDKAAAYRSSSGGVTARASRMTTVTLRAESTAKSVRSSSPICRADADGGSTRSSGKPQLAPRNGAPSTSNNATIDVPISTARPMTNFAQRYQNVCSTSLRT